MLWEVGGTEVEQVFKCYFFSLKAIPALLCLNGIVQPPLNQEIFFFKKSSTVYVQQSQCGIVVKGSGL